MNTTKIDDPPIAQDPVLGGGGAMVPSLDQAERLRDRNGRRDWIVPGGRRARREPGCLARWVALGREHPRASRVMRALGHGRLPAMVCAYVRAWTPRHCKDPCSDGAGSLAFAYL